jgi:hypothetical protein
MEFHNNGSRGVVRQNSWQPDIDDFVYLTFRNNEPGTVGMGYVGTVCADDVTARTNLCEYLNDDMTSGHVRPQHQDIFVERSLTIECTRQPLRLLPPIKHK